jgi:hypothetical protein
MLEERGQDAVFFAEHTHIPASRQTPYPQGGELPVKYWHCYDQFVALTAAAAATARLWWVRADGSARLLDADDAEGRAAIARLVGRYAQYHRLPPTGPVLAIDVERWSGWSAAAD